MPLNISNLVKQTSEEADRLPKELFKLIEDETDYLGTGVSEDGDVSYMAYDIYDKLSNKPVMKCVFSIVETDEGRVVGDIDLIINNDERTVLFQEFRTDYAGVNENWKITGGRENRETEVQTVNRKIIHADLKGKSLPVSLSAFPFEIVIGKSIEEVNKQLGFKPDKYRWLGHSPETFVGLGEDFMSVCEPFSKDPEESFSVFIGEVLDLKKCCLQLGDIEQECVIVELITALGAMPVYLPISYLSQIERGDFLAVFADVKADLSCGRNSYYKQSAVA